MTRIRSDPRDPRKSAASIPQPFANQPEWVWPVAFAPTECPPLSGKFPSHFADVDAGTEAVRRVFDETKAELLIESLRVL